MPFGWKATAIVEFGNLDVNSILGTKHKHKRIPEASLWPRVSVEEAVETHTYFTESPLELVMAGTGELGSPPMPGAGATILAGIWPARRSRCEHRKWGQEVSSEGIVATSEMMRRYWWHSSGAHSFIKVGLPQGKDRPLN